jgi:hypothetical protein
MLKTRSYQIPSVEGEVEKEGGMKEMGDGRRMGDDDDGGGKEGGETEQEKARRTIPDRARFLVWMAPSLSTPGVCLQQRHVSVNKEYLRSTVDRLVKVETVSTIYR